MSTRTAGFARALERDRAGEVAGHVVVAECREHREALICGARTELVEDPAQPARLAGDVDVGDAGRERCFGGDVAPLRCTARPS